MADTSHPPQSTLAAEEMCPVPPPSQRGEAHAEHLRRCEEGCRALFENSREPMYIVDPAARIVAANQALGELLGCAPAELIGRELQSFFCLSADAWRRLREQLGRERSVCDYELRLRRGDGSERDCLLTASVRQDAGGSLLGYQGIVRDITVRRREEARMRRYQEQLRILSSRLTLAEEELRREIALNLHDRLGQTLALLQMKVDALRASDPGAGLPVRLDEISALLDQADAETRSLISDLYPPVLYELGLAAAVKWLAGQFQERHGLFVAVEESGRPGPLPKDSQNLLFRAVRELLVNVVKHAHAARSRIVLHWEETSMRLQVEDDGAGFDPSRIDACENLSGGFGLFSIRERMDFIGGSFHLESAPDQGTSVILTAPLDGTVSLSREAAV